ncbi:MAG: 30S ribosomal protein S3 [Candidatus Omnitrophica bacterium]|nr:30S ribosomal protein S3 [Candidatus Omnitrophota bacterium]
MGQKVHPFIQRIGILRTWHSRWFANPKEYARFIEEDYRIRKLILAKFKQASISKIVIERLTEKVKIRIFSARPGIIIGRHGADIEKLREELNALMNKEVAIDIEEVKNPMADAQLVAQNIVGQIEKRVAFRRSVKRALEQAMQAGAKGAKICAAGRLDGAEMCRVETYKQGKVPLQTLRADIEYGFCEALTTYGLIGIKVWIFKGEVLPKPREARQPAQAAGVQPAKE